MSANSDNPSTNTGRSESSLAGGECVTAETRDCLYTIHPSGSRFPPPPPSLSVAGNVCVCVCTRVCVYTCVCVRVCMCLCVDVCNVLARVCMIWCTLSGVTCVRACIRAIKTPYVAGAYELFAENCHCTLYPTSHLSSHTNSPLLFLPTPPPPPFAKPSYEGSEQRMLTQEPLLRTTILLFGNACDRWDDKRRGDTIATLNFQPGQKAAWIL